MKYEKNVYLKEKAAMLLKKAMLKYSTERKQVNVTGDEVIEQALEVYLNGGRRILREKAGRVKAAEDDDIAGIGF